MTKKEVAKEIFDKYMFVEIANYTSMFEVKQCALIAVELLIKYEGEWYDTYYWKEVKQEIENL